MQTNFSTSQVLRKPAISSPHGIVAAQHRRAAEIGAAVLADGGDAADAAVAVSFALGALEPWMSGMGGGGAMVLYRAREARYEVIDYGMRAPDSLRVDAYPLAGTGPSGDLFPWPRVAGDCNVHGPKSIAVPGVVAGMGELHRRYGSKPWTELLQPAIQAAKEGVLVDWFTTENIAAGAPDLRRYPHSASVYLPGGEVPTAAWGVKTVVRVPLGALADSIAQVATRGADDFYRGDLAQVLAQDMREGGGFLSVADLSAYRAVVREPLVIAYRDAQIFATPELTAGPTLAHTLRQLSAWQPDNPQRGDAPDAAAYAAYGRALQEAYAARLSEMGDVDGARTLGAAPLKDERAPQCTTHFCVVDRHGNMVSNTQTLLSIFGSRYVLPTSGVLMNNGIMWFDPEPGQPNSLAPGKRCLTNYTPILGEQSGRRFGLGASGGRRILPAVAQLTSFIVDYGMDLDRAFHTSRIDASEGKILIGDTNLPAETQARLASSFDYVAARRQHMPLRFACPSGVMRFAGINHGASEAAQPWADAVAADGIVA